MYYKVYDCESEELYEGRFKEKKKRKENCSINSRRKKKNQMHIPIILLYFQNGRICA